jgi:hypothetical protein
MGEMKKLCWISPLDVAQPAFVFSSGNWRFCLDDRDDGPDDDDYIMYNIFEATTFDAM